jgi:tRNA(Ile)-lysidine synthase
VRHDPAVLATRRAVRDGLAGLPAGDLVLAAVSGGADSLALAAALAHVAPSLGLRAGAVTVDHGLQDGAAERAAAVAATCRDLGLDPVVVERVGVGTAGGPEAAARAARHAGLDRVLAQTGGSAVLLGHTLDDQAETVLLGLARGSGGRSLAGMRSESGARRRPLLGLRREVTKAACAALGLDVWDDPHNNDPAYARSRVRADLLPALEAALGPGTVEALGRTADLLRADADALDEWARTSRQPGVGDLSVDALLALPGAVRRRVLHRAAIDAGSPAGALSAGHVAELDRLLVDWHGQGPVALPGGLVGERRCDRLRFR